MKEYPYTYMSDYSTYDATNGFLLRSAFDMSLFQFLHKYKIIEYEVNGVTGKQDADAYF